MRDDLGIEVPLLGRPARIVSLVPSLTEALAVDHRDQLVGVTDWCTHPGDLDVARVRGTKNPNVAQIVELAPDVVIANKEENRELDVRRLREAGVAVWVTDIESVDESFSSMRRLWAECLDAPIPGWLIEAEAIWAEPVNLEARKVACCIWRDPWMVVGRDTFTGDMLNRLGVDHVFANATGRYPAVDLADLDSMDLDLVLLPDEPYVFTAEDGPEAFTSTPTALCSGRALTWFGPSMLKARTHLESVLR
ncbi:MAG: cobalamin-binding protein [Actinomycetales bacterium]|nr:cobalamin-binding protein [Actinomycetales bacterium]